MRVLGIACGLVLAGLLSMPSPSRADPQVTPATSSIVQVTAIKGVAASDAVVYRQNGLRLGAVVAVDGEQKLIWSRSLPATAVSISSPGPTGLLQGIIRFPGSERTKIFAYRVGSTGVISAILGRPTGQVSAEEGANFHGLSFTLRNPDASHAGSVKYRFQTTYRWTRNVYAPVDEIRVPDYAPSAYPVPNATLTTKSGDTVLIRLEIADTDAERTRGLMYRTSLDPDAGMVFVWPDLTDESFWMDNTYIPLSIAFLGPDGRVQEIQDMAALTTTYHTPAMPYRYAIEANLGYFKDEGIAPGDVFSLHLAA